ncbi:MAG TPA: CBS domain-containing protein [Solirubrobacteraceae bacterium]|nr:CBS domain-containing protein [Solirubrobacteraceae bacterium]
MPDPSVQPFRSTYLIPSLAKATVADVMHPGILSCPTTASLIEVARMMATYHVHCVAVMQPEANGSGARYVWGIVSDLDLIRAAVEPGSTPDAGALAAQPTISVKTAMPLADAADLMLRHGVSHLVVIEDETLRPIGVLSTLDVVSAIAWGRSE